MNNHWFDALAYACVAGYYCGVRLVQEEVKPKPVAKPKPKASRGSMFSVGGRTMLRGGRGGEGIKEPDGRPQQSAIPKIASGPQKLPLVTALQYPHQIGLV